MKFFQYFLFLWVIFALRIHVNPDPKPGLWGMLSPEGLPHGGKD
jgi:hypothetical protein